MVYNINMFTTQNVNLVHFEFRFIGQRISAFLTISITSHVFKRVINLETTFPILGHHWENLQNLPRHPRHISKTSPKSSYSYFHETTLPIFGHHWENRSHHISKTSPKSTDSLFPRNYFPHFVPIFANYLRSFCELC